MNQQERSDRELCDVVDQSGTRTGGTVERGTKLGSNEFYPVVHVWIRDDNHNYLIQQRGLHLESGPGVWATTVGYVVSGEESIDAAIREVQEELKIKLMPVYLNHIDRHVLDNRLEDVWMAEASRDALGTPIPGEEVEAYKWVSRKKLEELVNQGEMFRYSYHGKFF